MLDILTYLPAFGAMKLKHQANIFTDIPPPPPNVFSSPCVSHVVSIKPPVLVIWNIRLIPLTSLLPVFSSQQWGV
jgi:hypothetical protein